MTKLNVNKTAAASPAAEIIAKSVSEVAITDAKGRSITLRKPGVLAQFRLIETLGGETASNSTYVRMVLPLIYVAAIDGESVPPFVKKSQVEALIQQLDEDGIAAVALGVDKHFGGQAPEDDKAKLGN